MILLFRNMCITAEVRVTNSDGIYRGTHPDLRLLSELIQHLLLSHEDVFTCMMLGHGTMCMVVRQPDTQLENR